MRLQNEVEYLRHLDHPQIVQYLASEKTKTEFFIVLEYTTHAPTQCQHDNTFFDTS